MQLGAYSTPTSLAGHPFAAAFWTLLAPPIALYATIFGIDLLSDGWASGQLGDPETPKTAWIMFAIAHLALFMAMSLWAERVGAGPFAGRLPAPTDWFLIAIATGPAVLIGSNALVGALVSGGEPGWMYREGFDPALMSRQALGAMLVVYALLLAPLVEEVAFRGIALGCLLMRGWTPAMATALVAAVFASLHIHYTLPALIPVFIMGLYLGWLRVASGSIGVAILGHVSANSVSLALFAAMGG